MYRHLIAYSGAVAAGPGGLLAASVYMGVDVVQAWKGKRGGKTEVIDDIAGLAIGVVARVGGPFSGWVSRQVSRIVCKWSRMKSLIAQAVAVVALLCALSTGCDRVDDNSREVIAKNADWTVTTVGDLGAHGRGWGQNIVRFEVSKANSGSAYARGDLYASSLNKPFVSRSVPVKRLDTAKRAPFRKYPSTRNEDLAIICQTMRVTVQ